MNVKEIKTLLLVEDGIPVSTIRDLLQKKMDEYLQTNKWMLVVTRNSKYYDHFPTSITFLKNENLQLIPRRTITIPKEIPNSLFTFIVVNTDTSLLYSFSKLAPVWARGGDTINLS